MNRQQFQRRNTRFGLSDSMLKLLVRSKGQDLLLAAEQDDVERVTLPITSEPAALAAHIESGFELIDIGPMGATLQKFIGIHDPIPAGRYEAATQGV